MTVLDKMRSFSKVPGGGQPVRTLNLGSQEVLNALDIHQHSTCFLSPCTHFEQIVKHVGVFVPPEFAANSGAVDALTVFV